MHHFAPHGFPVYLPLGLLEQWVDRSTPGAPSPELVPGLHGAEIFLFYDVPEATFAALRGRVRDRLGLDLLLPGRSLDGNHHVAVLPSVLERIERGGPEARRLRALLP